jgi:heme/copper-type cytochrome/quinol oxidase subunit 4
MRVAHKYAASGNKLFANARIVPLLIFFVALLGFMAMYMFVHVFPLSGSAWNYGFCTLAIIVLGLCVPYWMLKLGVHEAHLINPKEKELTLEAFSKDQDQLEKETSERMTGSESHNRNKGRIENGEIVWWWILGAVIAIAITCLLFAVIYYQGWFPAKEQQ